MDVLVLCDDLRFIMSRRMSVMTCEYLLGEKRFREARTMICRQGGACMGMTWMLNERGDGPPVYTYEPVPGAPPVSV